MRSNERIAFLAFGSAVAFASAAIVLTLDQYGIATISAPPLPTPLHASFEATAPLSSSPPLQPSPSPPTLPFGSPRLLFSIPGQRPLAEATPVEEYQEWSAETVPETASPSPVPRLAALPPQRLPWQSPGPVGSSRSYTLIERLAEISPAANKRLASKFEAANASWPPTDVGLVAVKDEKILELFARSNGGVWKFIHRYPVLAASGTAGPKLRQGDKQVPEGVYDISFLNPNSRYHVSLRVDFPNAFDREMAAKDGRANLGGDIMIHGKNVSIGCLAIGDEAAEELFVLAASTGLGKVKLIIAPTDFRQNGMPTGEPASPAWLPKLYTEVANAMSEFKAPPSSNLLSLFSQ